jgi:gliding motility-associated-like protein
MLLNYVNAAALTISHDTVICPNVSIPLIASGGISYNWHSMNGSFLSCTNCNNPNISINAGGLKDSFVVVANMQGGCILRDTVIVRAINAPVANFQINSPVCLNSPTQINFTGFASGTAAFNWNFGSGTISNLGTSIIGPYSISWSNLGLQSVSLQISDSGCVSNMLTQNANVLSSLPINVVLSHDTICAEDIVQVQELNNISSGLYNWNFGNGIVLNGTNAGPFTIRYLNTDSIKLSISANGCSSIPQTKHVFVKPLPISSFFVQDSIVCSKQMDSLFYNGLSNLNGGALNYHWNFGTAYTKALISDSIYNLHWLNNSLQNIFDTIGLVLEQDACFSHPFMKPILIHPNPIPQIQLIQDTICKNASTVASAQNSLLNANGSPPIYNWNFGGLNAIPGGNSIGPHNLSVNSNYDSISSVWISLSLSQDACLSEKGDSALLIIIPQPKASFNLSKNPICSGVPVTISFNGITNTFNGGTVNYNWNFTSGIATPGTGIGPHLVTYQNLDTSLKDIFPSLVVTQDGCTSTVFIDTLSLFPTIDFNILATPNFCIGQTGYLYPSKSFSAYQWSTGSSNDSLLVQISGHYVLRVTDSNGCTDSNSYNLNIKPAPHANAGSDASIYLGNFIQLDGSSSYGGTTYNWTPFVNMSFNNIASPYVAPSNTIQYVLSYSDSTNGCVDRDTVTIFVMPCSDLIIPNAFSPNQDGTDDYFMIMNPEAIYKLVQLSIYNRWGQKVFESDDKNSFGWDGKFNGKDQEIGSYVYLIIAECGGGKQYKLKGNLTLIR